MSAVHSYEGDLEIQSDGVSGEAGYTVLALVGSAKLTASRTNTVVPRRGKEIKTTKNGQADVEITADVVWDNADTMVAALESAFWENTHVGVKFLDTTAGTGLTSDMLVTQWDFDQSEDNIQMVHVTLKPTYVDTDPAWA